MDGIYEFPGAGMTPFCWGNNTSQRTKSDVHGIVLRRSINFDTTLLTVCPSLSPRVPVEWSNFGVFDSIIFSCHFEFTMRSVAIDKGTRSPRRSEIRLLNHDIGCFWWKVRLLSALLFRIYITTQEGHMNHKSVTCNWKYTHGLASPHRALHS